MRTRKISGLILFGSVVAAVVIGCGGGGGGGSAAPSVKSTIDSAAVQKVASRVVSNGMCTLVSGSITSSSIGISTSSISSNMGTSSSAQANSSVGGQSSSYNPFPAATRGYEYDNTYNGVLGGTMDVHRKHENGTTDDTFTMSNFENIINGKDINLNGSAQKTDHGKPGDYGPVVSNTTAKTNGAVDADVKNNSRAVESTQHFSVELKGYNLVYTTEFGKPNKLTIDLAKLTDKDESKEYSVTNLKADAYGMADQLANMTAVYNDADVGTLKVSQKQGIITITKEAGPGNIPTSTSISGVVDLEATDGTMGALEIQGSSVKIYTKDANGQKILVSELNCPILSE